MPGQGTLFELPVGDPRARGGLHWRRWGGESPGSPWRGFTLFDGETRTGFEVEHCGHPTALRPWRGTHSPRCYRLLQECQGAAIAAYLAGEPLAEPGLFEAIG